MELALAPLQTFTDHHFRNALLHVFGGVDRWFAPYLKLNNDRTIKPSTLIDIEPKLNTRLQLVPQLMASTASDFLVMSTKIEQLGYSEMNLNIGCPYPMVTNKCLGAALTEQQDTLLHLLDTVVPRLNARLGIKMRMGMTSTSPILDLLPKLNAYPLTEVIVHARYAKQLYTGTCDHDQFYNCSALTRHKLWYNGDITSQDDVTHLRSTLKGDFPLMIGRGALKNPGIFRALKGGQTEITREEYLSFNELLKQSLIDSKSEPGHVLTKLKGYWEYLCEHIEDGNRLYRKLKKSTRIGEFENYLDDYLE